MNKSGLSLVGWYHSHPHRSASPTLRDIDCQMTYQLKMKGVGSVYHPCLGFIIAPYNKSSKKKESTFRAFWVMPPLVEVSDDHWPDYWFNDSTNLFS
ncbi:MPN domain-containing protein [Octopus bimaculoides]|uniref:MPN domain-containing protein n=1 Tax=Octopus bimaculoides TaxID=37653 RepID=A0A0L8FWK2_OCTBM|nr:MPN domain-containing protein [Octopus bimaculoides]